MTKTKTIVITGASSGLGENLYESFSKSYNVVNISRSISKSNNNIIVDFVNLSELKNKLKFEKVSHDLCILNAGTMGKLGLAHKIKNNDFFNSIKINVLANKIIIDWSISNGCKFFIGISSGAAIKNYDGWLNYCVTKSAFRTMILQYQKDLPKLNFKLISPGILKTNMNKKIKNLDVNLFPDMEKFHKTLASDPKKASEIIYKRHNNYFKKKKLEIDLRDETDW